MLPDPKKVARFINRTLFKSVEERHEEDERDRKIEEELQKIRERLQEKIINRDLLCCLFFYCTAGKGISLTSVIASGAKESRS